jgi:hypothetical protein
MNTVHWTDPRLDKIMLLDLHLILDAWQVTQCEGRLKNGERVFVTLPFSQLPRYGLRKAIIKYAQEAGVYAKGIGIFDAINT